MEKPMWLTPPMWLLFLVSSFSVITIQTSMAAPYAVFTDQPKDQSNRDFAIQVLSNVLGSQKAAEKALLAVFRSWRGFIADLTPEQASQIENQPGVASIFRGGDIGSGQ